MLKSKKVFGGALVCVALLGVAGCDDPKTDTPAPGAKTTAAPSAEPAAKPAESAKAAVEDSAKSDASGGAIFKFMPAECASGRVYANIGKLVGKDLQANLDTLQEKMLASMGGADAAKGQEVAKVFKEGGFEPGRDLKEVAVCMGPTAEPPVIAIAISESVKEPIQLIAKAMETAGGKAKPTVEKEGDVTYLTQAGEDGALAEVAPGVILLGKDKAAVAALAKGGDGAAAFSEAPKYLVWADVAPGPNDPAIDGTLSDGADSYDLKVGIEMKGSQAEAMKKDPEKFAKEMEGMAQKAAADLEKGPLKPLAEHVKSAKFSVDGDKLIVSAAIPKSAVNDAGKAVADAKPEELMKAL